MSVGVMKDYKLKRRNIRTSHTLGWSWNWSLFIQGPSTSIIEHVNTRHHMSRDGQVLHARTRSSRQSC
jgi:hypothetical protein